MGLMLRRICAAVDHVRVPLKTPRDRILSARSEDGLTWQPERGACINVLGKTFPRVDMAYTCWVHSIQGAGFRFEMFFQGSENTYHGWICRILRATSFDGRLWCRDEKPVITQSFHPLCIKRVNAPYIVACGDLWRMYYIGVAEDGVSRSLSAVSHNKQDWEPEEHTRLDPQACSKDVTGILDACVVPFPEGYRMYFTAEKRSVFYQDIRSAFSYDGLNWQVEKGIRICANGEGYRLWANNPHVIPFGSGWRMYFRGSDNPPLWSNIYTAFSLDGMDWQVEGLSLKFRRLARYERHGVAFPFVLRLPDGAYRMYYTGYWGNLLDSESIKYYFDLHKKAFNKEGQTSI